MHQAVIAHALGYVRCTRCELIDDNWDAGAASIELDAARFGPEALLVVVLEGATLREAGLGATDGAPVIDIKAVMSAFLPRGAFKELDWAIEIMRVLDRGPLTAPGASSFRLETDCHFFSK